MVNYGTSTALSALIVADAPLLYWKLDEATGVQFADSSGNSRPSTTNTGITRQQPALSAESGGYSIQLSQAAGSYATIPDAAALDAASPTFEILFRTSVTTVIQHLCGKYGASGATQSLMVRIATNGDFQVIFRTDTVALTTYTHTPAFDYRDGRPHHMAVTYDPATDKLTLYLDGAQAQQWTVAGTTMYNGSGGVGIGSVGQTLQGAEYLDEFAYYGTVLTAARIAEHAWAAGVGLREMDSVPAATARVNSIFTPAAVSETDTAHGAFVEGIYAKVVTADNPLLYYRMNDAGGGGTSVLDSSGHGWNGTMATSTAAPTAGVASLIAADSVNKAFSFDGGDSFTRGSAGAAIYASRTTDSVEAWFKTSTINAAIAPIAGTWGSTSSSKRIRVQLTTSGFAQAICRINSVADYTATGAVDLRDGLPHHIVATMVAGDALRLYVDGVEVANTPISAGTTQAAGDSFRVGVTGSGETASNFTGVIDEVAFYDTALSATRVAAHYAAAITASIAMGVAIETDTAVAASVATSQSIGAGVATETETAPSVGTALTSGPALETDSALDTLLNRGFLVDPATETDSAQPATISVGDNIIVTPAVETDVAIAADVGFTVLAGLAQETDTALAGTVLRGAGVAIETDTAMPATVVGGTYYATVMADDPSLYWRMDEEFPPDESGNGYVADYSAHEGTYVDGLILSETNQAVKGGDRSILQVDESGDIGRMWGKTVTFELWLSVTESGVWLQQIYDASSLQTTAIETQFNGTVRMRHYNGSSSYYITGPVITDGRPHHIVVTAYNDPSVHDMHLYVDGALVGVVDVPFDASYEMGQFLVGDAFSEGIVDEVAVYDHELSAQEVFRHFMMGGWSTAIETDTAKAPAVAVEILAGVATEADAAQAITLAFPQYAGVATEADSAHGHLAVTLALSGEGVLQINGEYVIAPPEYRLEILDKIIDRAPASVTLTLAGAIPERDVTFFIDGTEVWTTQADTDGNLVAISLNISSTVGGDTVGTHTITAEQTDFAGDIITASDTYQIQREPALNPIVQGGDVNPVEVPGALEGSVRSWVWQDLLGEDVGGIGSWIMPLNPREMSPPHFEHSFSSRHTTAKAGQFHIFAPGRTMKEWKFSGYAPDQAFCDKLLQYRNLNRRFYIIDHHNRAWTVVINEIELIPRLRHTWVPAGGEPVQDDWGSDYTVTATVLSQDFKTPVPEESP